MIMAIQVRDVCRCSCFIVAVAIHRDIAVAVMRGTVVLEEVLFCVVLKCM